MRKLKGFLEKINKHAENVGNPYQTFGIFGLFTYPLYYFIWIFADSQGYENLYLRIVAVILCIPLIFVKKWPLKFYNFLPLYWYATLLYCLPFLFTFLLLKNDFSYAWTLNAMTVLVLSVLLLDLPALMIILPLGILLGVLAYLITGNITFPNNLSAIIISYFSIILFGALFAHRKKVIQDQKLQTIKNLSETIAHELRTPLRSILFGAEGLHQYLPQLVNAYELAVNADLQVDRIEKGHVEILINILDNIIAEVKATFTFINLLLFNAREDIVTTFKKCSINDCISEALARYPFNGNEKKAVIWRKADDFYFNGDQELMIHVLFNLFKNSLYYIKAANKGEIYIWTEGDKLHFKDTGLGISKNNLPHIFDRFYSKTYHGTGIGLSFCKLTMKSFGGDIFCRSQEGQYAEFIMKFTVIE